MTQTQEALCTRNLYQTLQNGDSILEQVSGTINLQIEQRSIR